MIARKYQTSAPAIIKGGVRSTNHSIDVEQEHGGSHSSSGYGSSVNPLSENGLKQRQQEVIKLQDSLLDDIEHGVSRLHIQVREILRTVD